jgi:hypothetical protein
MDTLQKLCVDCRLLARILLRVEDKLGVKVNVDSALDTMLKRAHKDATNGRVDLVLAMSPCHVDNVKGKVVFRHNLPTVTIRLRQMAEHVENETARRALLLLAKCNERVLLGKVERLVDDRTIAMNLEARECGAICLDGGNSKGSLISIVLLDKLLGRHGYG